VGRPRVGLEVEDAGAEGAQHRRDVGDAGDLVQIFVAGGEPVGEAAPPAVHKGQ
jgi:hypothetical protein